MELFVYFQQTQKDAPSTGRTQNLRHLLEDHQSHRLLQDLDLIQNQNKNL